MKKTLIVLIAISLLTFLLLEIGSLLLFRPLSGLSFSYQALQESRKERISSIRKSPGSPNTQQTLYSFHPYIGYSGRAGAHPWGDAQPAFNDYGMLSTENHEYPYHKKPGEIVVAVLGGSVASIFANRAESSLNDFLKVLNPSWDGKIVLIDLATGGYKQPQQLFHLQYAILAGFEFDAVLNIDGFNDLVLSVANMNRGINPIFPSGHHIGLMSKLGSSSWLDPVLVEQLANHYSIQRQELRVLKLVERRPFSYSVFMNLFGEVWSQLSVRRINSNDYLMTMESQKSLTQEFRGPAWNHDLNPYKTAAELWARSSRLLHDISTSQGLLYIHILQPNQYVDGSKILSAREREIAFDLENPWGKIAHEGYSYLISAGLELSSQGVAYHDFTMIFAEETQNLYIDTCCHFNQQGNMIVAKEIAQLLNKKLW